MDPSFALENDDSRKPFLSSPLHSICGLQGWGKVRLSSHNSAWSRRWLAIEVTVRLYTTLCKIIDTCFGLVCCCLSQGDSLYIYSSDSAIVAESKQVLRNTLIELGK